MSEALNQPVQITVGYDRINAWWLNDEAIWTSGYNPNENPETEARQFAIRRARLSRNFDQNKLLEPTVEVLDLPDIAIDDMEKHDSAKIGGHLLRVSTLVMPYVDSSYLRPIVGLGLPAPSEQDARNLLVERCLKVGGQAIQNCFGASIPKPDSLWVN